MAFGMASHRHMVHELLVVLYLSYIAGIDRTILFPVSLREKPRHLRLLHVLLLSLVSRLAMTISSSK